MYLQKVRAFATNEAKSIWLNEYCGRLGLCFAKI